MNYKGINYDAGIDYNNSGEGKYIDLKEFKKDINWIKKLNCNSIRLYGSHNDKLLEYTKLALDNNLIVWVSPRYIDHTKEETLKKLLLISKPLEKLRKKDNLYFIIGNEFTLDMKGIVSGKKLMKRI